MFRASKKLALMIVLSLCLSVFGHAEPPHPVVWNATERGCGAFPIVAKKGLADSAPLYFMSAGHCFRGFSRIDKPKVTRDERTGQYSYVDSSASWDNTFRVYAPDPIKIRRGARDIAIWPSGYTAGDYLQIGAYYLPSFGASVPSRALRSFDHHHQPIVFFATQYGMPIKFATRGKGSVWGRSDSQIDVGASGSPVYSRETNVVYGLINSFARVLDSRGYVKKQMIEATSLVGLVSCFTRDGNFNPYLKTCILRKK